MFDFITLGYANEVGEAFRHMIPRSAVWLTYFISSGYVLADTIDKGYQAYQVKRLSLINK